jgi:hypothetical protein
MTSHHDDLSISGVPEKRRSSPYKEYEDYNAEVERHALEKKHKSDADARKVIMVAIGALTILAIAAAFVVLPPVAATATALLLGTLGLLVLMVLYAYSKKKEKEAKEKERQKIELQEVHNFPSKQSEDWGKGASGNKHLYRTESTEPLGLQLKMVNVKVISLSW